MERLVFRMGDAFPADCPIAVWVTNLSIGLGDLRIVIDLIDRDDVADYELIYFVRLFASHVREVAKLIHADPRDRQDVRDFVATLPAEAQEARESVVRILHSSFRLRPDVVVWEDIKRLRDDTSHYARDDRSGKESHERLVQALRDVADHHGYYFVADDERLRAGYADLVTANRMHPFGEADDGDLPFTNEQNDTIIELAEHVGIFIAHVETRYLFDVVGPDKLRREVVQD